MAKRIRNKRRARTRQAIVLGLTNKLKGELSRLSLLSPDMSEVVAAQVDYYFTCNPAEQEILMRMFKEQEDETLTALAER